MAGDHSWSPPTPWLCSHCSCCCWSWHAWTAWCWCRCCWWGCCCCSWCCCESVAPCQHQQQHHQTIINNNKVSSLTPPTWKRFVLLISAFKVGVWTVQTILSEEANHWEYSKFFVTQVIDVFVILVDLEETGEDESLAHIESLTWTTHCWTWGNPGSNIPPLIRSNRRHGDNSTIFRCEEACCTYHFISCVFYQFSSSLSISSLATITQSLSSSLINHIIVA